MKLRIKINIKLKVSLAVEYQIIIWKILKILLRTLLLAEPTVDCNMSFITLQYNSANNCNFLVLGLKLI